MGSSSISSISHSKPTFGISEGTLVIVKSPDKPLKAMFDNSPTTSYSVMLLSSLVIDAVSLTLTVVSKRTAGVHEMPVSTVPTGSELKSGEPALKLMPPVVTGVIPVPLPPTSDGSAKTVGAILGDLSITVTSDSINGLPYTWVCATKVSSPCPCSDPALNLAISIFFGSELSSVQNSIPPNILTPVIRLLVLKFSTLFVSTNTGATIEVAWSYSSIASTVSLVINQYIFSF